MALALAGPIPGRASNSDGEAVLMFTAASDSEAVSRDSAAKRNFFIRRYSIVCECEWRLCVRHRKIVGYHIRLTVSVQTILNDFLIYYLFVY